MTIRRVTEVEETMPWPSTLEAAVSIDRMSPSVLDESQFQKNLDAVPSKQKSRVRHISIKISSSLSAIPDFTEFQNVVMFDLSGMNIGSIENLRKLKNVRAIRIQTESIRDLSPLLDVAGLRWFEVRIIWLNYRIYVPLRFTTL